METHQKNKLSIIMNFVLKMDMQDPTINEEIQTINDTITLTEPDVEISEEAIHRALATEKKAFVMTYIDQMAFVDREYFKGMVLLRELNNSRTVEQVRDFLYKKHPAFKSKRNEFDYYNTLS